MAQRHTNNTASVRNTKRLKLGRAGSKKKQNRTLRESNTLPESQSLPTTRDTLLKAAKHVFALKGLSGTSIRDIAQSADMNSSQISYYFKNKEGLYRECLLDIAKDRIHMTEKILIPPESKEEFVIRLRMYATDLIEYFLTHRDTGLIIIRESDRIHSPAADIFQSYFSQMYKLLSGFFTVAYKKSFAKAGLDPLLSANVFLGALMSALRLDHMNESLYGRTLKNPAERKILVEQMVALFTQC